MDVFRHLDTFLFNVNFSFIQPFTEKGRSLLPSGHMTFIQRPPLEADVECWNYVYMYSVYTFKKNKKNSPCKWQIALDFCCPHKAQGRFSYDQHGIN